ncbi:MAG: hypothetical protein CMK32_05140 [Porticoccaceae bacterium]|nr:hypothetical protein [Porticoccaceae bacterium]
MIFSSQDLRHMVIRPTLKYLDHWTAGSENLLVATAIQESGLGFCLQQGRRFGIYHISPGRHRAVWDHYLVHQPDMASCVRGLAGQHAFLDDPNGELLSNLKYATAIAWCIYRMSGAKIPAEDDIQAMAILWRDVFHAKPAGCVETFVKNYRELGQLDSQGHGFIAA